MQYTPKSAFHGTTPEAWAAQLANLKRGSKKTRGKKSKPFLRDPKNHDIRWFIERHIMLPNGSRMRLEPFQTEILDALLPENGRRP